MRITSLVLHHLTVVLVCYKLPCSCCLTNFYWSGTGVAKGHFSCLLYMVFTCLTWASKHRLQILTWPHLTLLQLSWTIAVNSFLENEVILKTQDLVSEIINQIANPSAPSFHKIPAIGLFLIASCYLSAARPLTLGLVKPSVLWHPKVRHPPCNMNPSPRAH